VGLIKIPRIVLGKVPYPSDVCRKPIGIWPKDFKIDIKKMVKEKIVEKFKSVFVDEE